LPVLVEPLTHENAIPLELKKDLRETSPPQTEITSKYSHLIFKMLRSFCPIICKLEGPKKDKKMDSI